MSTSRSGDSIDHKAEAWENALSQYKGGDSESNWQKWWGTFFDAMNYAEEAVWDAADQLSVLDCFPNWTATVSSTTDGDVTTYFYTVGDGESSTTTSYSSLEELKAAILADAARLDVVGAFAGVARTSSETLDEDSDTAEEMASKNASYYTRVAAKLAADDDGTPDKVIGTVSAETGDASPGYCETWPAKWVVWTPAPTTRTRATRDTLDSATPCGVGGFNGLALGLHGSADNVLGTTYYNPEAGDNSGAVLLALDPDVDEGSETVTYAVTLEGENVELSATSASYGDEVTISAAAGYTLTSVEATAGTLAENDDGTWTLTMPAEDVTVTASAELVTYAVTLVGENVEASAAEASEGSEVVISAAAGYTLTSVEASAGTLTENDDGTWTLVMPAEDVTVTATAEEVTAVTLDVSLGDIVLTSTGYTAEGATEETAWLGAYVITGAATEHSVSVTSGDLAVTLSSVDVELSDGSSTSNLGTAAFSVSEGASVSLTLEGDNVLSSGYGRAGLECSGAEVSVGGEGSLAATGGSYGAGIGGGYGSTTGGDGGTVTITDYASVTATGGTRGAGIGGGYGSTTGGDGGTVTITDSATVTATGSYGAGIGGGRGSTGGDGGTVTITGSAVVTATGGTYGAGIGGGSTPSGTAGSGGAVTISGSATVTATGARGAGIGGGGSSGSSGTAGSGGAVTISGSATVTATGSYGAGIGSGGYGHGAGGGSLSISGFAVVTAKNTSYGAAVGGGYGYSTSYTGNDGADVEVSGGFLFAFVSGGSSTYSAAAIGGGAGNGASYGGSSGTFTQTGGIVLAQTCYTVSDCIGNATGGSGDVPDLTAVSGGMVITYQGSSTAQTEWDMTEAANISDGAITLAGDSVWPEGYTLAIDEGETLAIADGCTLLCKGTITNDGTVSGEVDYG